MRARAPRDADAEGRRARAGDPGRSERGGADALLADAAAWRLLSLLLERPRRGWSEEIAALAAEVRDPTLCEAARAAPGATEGAYLAVLGPGGALSPREAAYRGLEDPARNLADLSGFFDAFAYRPAREDPPDHVAVSAGFVGYLRLKQAYARVRGDAEAEATTEEAARRFVEEHVRPMGGPLARRLEAAGAPAYLVGAARALVARVGDVPDPRSSPASEIEGCALGCGAEEAPRDVSWS